MLIYANFSEIVTFLAEQCMSSDSPDHELSNGASSLSYI